MFWFLYSTAKEKNIKIKMKSILLIHVIPTNNKKKTQKRTIFLWENFTKNKKKKKEKKLFCMAVVHFVSNLFVMVKSRKKRILN